MTREVNMRKKNAKEEGSATEHKNTKKSDDRIITDPFGSWTGINVDNCYEKPVQDVDDL